jgi:hypothetical protein
MRDVGATLAVALDGAGQCSAMRGRGEPCLYNRSDIMAKDCLFAPVQGKCFREKQDFSLRSK